MVAHNQSGYSSGRTSTGMFLKKRLVPSLPRAQFITFGSFFCLHSNLGSMNNEILPAGSGFFFLLFFFYSSLVPTTHTNKSQCSFFFTTVPKHVFH
jgi:hypothetical protein